MRGALKVLSYADPPESLLQHRQWQLRRPSDPGLWTVEVVEAAAQGSALRVRLAGVDDRDAAEALRDCEILIARDERPAAGAREYHCEDLIGFTVRNLDGTVFGTVRHFLEAPGGVLMVVGGERERWLPAVPPHLKRVLLDERLIEVDWPADI